MEVKKAIEKDGLALQKVSEILENDKDIVKAVVM